VEGEVDWEAVARWLVQTLGVEGARDLLYALLAQGYYPYLSQLVRQVASGERPSGELVERVKALAERVGALGGGEELERALASALGLVAEGAGLGVGAELRVEALKERIRTLERTKSELLAELYRTTDEGRRREIEESLRRLEERLREEYARLDTMLAILRG